MTNDSLLSKDAEMEKGPVPQPVRDEPELARERLSGSKRQQVERQETWAGPEHFCI